MWPANLWRACGQTWSTRHVRGDVYLCHRWSATVCYGCGQPRKRFSDLRSAYFVVRKYSTTARRVDQSVVATKVYLSGVFCWELGLVENIRSPRR